MLALFLDAEYLMPLHILIRRCLTFLFILFGIGGTCAADTGPLVIIGGGSTPAAARNAFIELAGGEEAFIVVIPHASNAENRGVGSVNAFRQRGVAEVRNLNVEDAAAAKALLEKATGIWFPGGSQGRLMKAMRDAGLVDTIRARHAAGVAFGGTSAGAAIMSLEMITHSPDKRRLAANYTPTAEGLGLAPELIIDQHFVARNRVVRLLSAVLDHPQLIGIGIDEGTAIVVEGDEFRVLGRGSVLVIDARAAIVSKTGDQQLQSAKDARLSVLRAGDRYSLEMQKEGVDER